MFPEDLQEEDQRARPEALRAALRESEERFRLFVNAGSDSLYRMSADWSELRSLEGKGFLADTRQPRRDWIDHYIPASEKERVAAAIAQAVRDKATFELEHRVLRGDGAAGWAFSRAIPLRDPHGEIVEWFGVASDITPRKRTEANLAFLAEASQDLMLLTNIEDTMATLGAKIGAHLGCPLVAFGEVDEAGETIAVRHAWNRQDLPSLRGVYRIRDFHTEEFRRASHAGETYVVRDATSDARTDAAALAQLNIASFVNVPLLREKSWRFQLTVYDALPRDWRADEIELMQEMTTRIWMRLERALAEEDLRETEARRQLALEAAEMGTFVWYPLEDRGEPDARMLRLFGLDDGDALHLAEALAAMIHPDDLGRYSEAVDRAIDPHGDGRLDEEIRILHPDQTLHWVAILAQTIFEDKEPAQVVRMYGTAADITGRKRAEERQEFLLKLADSLRLLTDPVETQALASRLLAEHLQVQRVAFAEIDGEEMIVHRDHVSGVTSMVGRHPKAAFGKKIAAAFFSSGTYWEEDLAASPDLSPAERSALAELGIAAYLGSTLSKQGRVAAAFAAHSATPRRWTPEEISLMTDVADRVWSAVERARALTAVREGEEKYRSLFDAIDEGFNIMEVLFDDRKKAIDCRILEINPAYLRHTGLPPSVVGRRLREFLPGIEEGLIERYGKVALTGRSLRFEQYIGALDRWFDCYASRVGGEGSHTVALVFSNVTEERRAAEKLREGDRRKSEFLAMLGHELRNPLAAVEGGLKLLQSPRARPESREAALPVVAQQVAHMKRLIDDVLDLARLDRGKLQVQPVEIELGATLEASIRMTESLAQTRGSQIRYQPPAAPIRLHADPERLVQVFANLLTNALKFSTPGSPVDLGVETGATALVRVRDYGRGIAPEDLEEIFEPFVQSRLSLGLPGAGLGLGLSVSRELVELHGGAIAASSAGVDQGSTFTVSLPLASPSP